MVLYAILVWQTPPVSISQCHVCSPAVRQAANTGDDHAAFTQLVEEQLAWIEAHTEYVRPAQSVRPRYFFVPYWLLNLFN